MTSDSVLSKNWRLLAIAVVLATGFALAYPPALFWIVGCGVVLFAGLSTVVQTRAVGKEPSWWPRDVNLPLKPREQLVGLLALVLIVSPLLALGIRALLEFPRS